MTRFRSVRALAVLALAVVAAGCGSSTKTVTTTAPQASATATPTATAPAPTTAPAAITGTTSTQGASSDDNSEPATVKGAKGATLTLNGSGLHDNVNDHTKSKVEVRLKGLNGPFRGFGISAGKELIGVKLVFKNVGTIHYDDPLPSGQLILASGATGKQTNLIQGQGKSPCDNPSLKLKTGQSKDVCIAFEVPKSDKPKTFQYVTDSGYGDTGLWKLR